jgi:hypothetical protein
MMALAKTERGKDVAVFAPGARVEISGEKWMVRTSEQTSTGGTAVHVTGLSDLVRKSAIFLTDLHACWRFADKLGIEAKAAS